MNRGRGRTGGSGATEVRTPWRRRQTLVLALATLLAGAATFTPPAAQPALGAESLRLTADAIYTLDPPAGAVHVAISMTATNLKPGTTSVIYYYRDLTFAIQEQATSILVEDSAGRLTTTRTRHERYIELEVRLRANLYYRQATRFTIRYDLVGGAPRSTSPIRVGRAFATFGVWAWGDPGGTSVEVRTPAGFATMVDGGPMTTETGPAGQRLRATPADPAQFYAIVTAENASAYASTSIELAGGVRVAILGWPEDVEWQETVATTLRRGLPELVRRVGLSWPVEGTLRIRERYTPSLEGYAGIYLDDARGIVVGEQLDPVTIIHEAAHAWFDADLFASRWIYEGLAEELAWQVEESVGGGAAPPERPDPEGAGHVLLESWRHPQAIRDEETDEREAYGYNAAFWVIHLMAQAAGEDQLRTAYRRAQDSLTAYAGAGPLEKVAPADGWRRLLDLVEPIEGTDPAALDQAMEELVAGESVAGRLADRRAARDAYRDLLSAGDGWLPPWLVRRPMGEWEFDDATEAITAATAVLDLRDRVLGAAAPLGLEPGDALEAAYETADRDLDAATTLGEQQLATLAAMSAARAALDAPVDLVSSVGLMGETPEVPYEAARAAFEGGDLAGAAASANAAAAVIAGAAAVGQGRIILAVAVAIVALVLLVLLAVLWRRRRRGARVLAGAAVAGAGAGETAGIVPDGAAPIEPYATLAADPPRPSAERPPGPEGPEGGSPEDDPTGDRATLGG